MYIMTQNDRSCQAGTSQTHPWMQKLQLMGEPASEIETQRRINKALDYVKRARWVLEHNFNVGRYSRRTMDQRIAEQSFIVKVHERVLAEQLDMFTIAEQELKILAKRQQERNAEILAIYSIQKGHSPYIAKYIRLHGRLLLLKRQAGEQLSPVENAILDRMRLLDLREIRRQRIAEYREWLPARRGA